MRLFLIALLIVLGRSPIGQAAWASSDDYRGVPASITPFDSRYRRVQTYIESLEQNGRYDPDSPGRPGSPPSLKGLKKHLKTAARFRYLPDPEGDGVSLYGETSFPDRKNRPLLDYWQLPEETESRRGGDCEDKAIWLYVRLIQAGFQNVRFIVGKYRIDLPAGHAWVAWYSHEGIYILDPTINIGIWKVRQYPEGFYVPLYSYSNGQRWHHRKNWSELYTRPMSQER